MKRPAWFKITNAADGAPAEVMLYGTIGGDWNGDGVDAKAFADEFKAIPAGAPINLRIHSPGGSVFDGLAIYNIVTGRRNDVTATIDGVALSAASFIAMAAGKIIMPKTARMMIHDAQGFVVGDSADMKQMADLLERESDRIAAIYAERTGRPQADLRALMQETTWMDGQEAVAGGFADELSNAAAVENSFDLSMFRLVPDDMKPTKPGVTNRAPATQHQVMNRAKIVALLNKHGVKFEPTATDEQLAGLLETHLDTLQARATTPVAAAGAADAGADLREIRDSLNRERSARVTNEVNALAAEHDFDPVAWLPKVLADESLLANLRNLPKKALPGADPIALGASSQGNSLLENYGKMKPGAARNAFRIENHDELVRQRKRADPKNANTIAAALTTDYLADGVITNANNVLASLTYFNRQFSQDGYKPRATVQIRNATTGSAAQTDPTNFETGDTTLANIAVAVHQVSKSFQVTNDELNRGTRLAFLAEQNAFIFVNAISDVWTTLLKGLAPDFGAGMVVGLSTAWNAPGTVLPPILAAAKNFPQQNLLMDGGYLAYLMPMNQFAFQRTEGNGFANAFGFNNIAPQNRWTGAVANAVGFVCAPNAIAAVAGLPLDTPAGEMISQAVVTLPRIDLSVQINTWFSRAGRVLWSSYDVMFGAAIGDKSVGKILISA